jgi:hypothetical protein
VLECACVSSVSRNENYYFYVLLIPVKNFLSYQCTSSAFGDEPHRMLKVIQHKQPHILFGCAALAN